MCPAAMLYLLHDQLPCYLESNAVCFLLPLPVPGGLKSRIRNLSTATLRTCLAQSRKWWTDRCCSRISCSLCLPCWPWKHQCGFARLLMLMEPDREGWGGMGGGILWPCLAGLACKGQDGLRRKAETPRFQEISSAGARWNKPLSKGVF